MLVEHTEKIIYVCTEIHMVLHKLELCMSVENTETQRSTVACVYHLEFNKLYVFTRYLYISIVMKT